MTTGVLPYRTFKDKVLLNSGFFECSSTDVYVQQGTTSGNHDDAGMSMGSLQYNFGSANRLTELWQYMINNHEQDCIDAFGANTAQYTKWKTAMLSTVQADRKQFGIDVTDPNNAHALIQPYKDIFMVLGNKQSHIDKYKSMADAYYFPVPEILFLTSTCTSRIAYASIFDAYINKGRFYPVNLIQADFDKIDADTTIDSAEKERQKNYQINYRANYDNAVNPNVNAWGTIDQDTFWHGDGVDDGRRGCMANQTGVYYGLTYDPDVQFDMSQEPAMSQKTSTLGVAFGANTILDIYNGSAKISKIYFGTQLLGSGATITTSSAVPKTQFRTNPASWAGIGTATSVSLTQGQKLWVDCLENPAGTLVACRTYYTIDGTTPTTSSPLYDKALTFDTSCTLKTLTVSLSGVAEAVKTLTVTIANVPTTTISPSATVQNNIPITVTLTATNSPTAIYYRLGATGAQQTYTGPFTVNQNSAGVSSANIKVTYWAVNATGTEAEKSIIYDTSGAIPATPVLTATAGNNQVALSWGATANTTSYTVLRDGVILTPSQYQTGTTYTDTTAVNGTQYSYVVQAGNWSKTANSSAVLATPLAPVVTKPTYRYIKFEGYGGTTVGSELTTRGIELEVISGGTNRVLNKTIVSTEVQSTGTGTPAMMINGSKATTANSYPIWWTALPNARTVIDMGAQYAIDQINYYSYSNTGDLRAYKFKILGSNTNNGTDWATVWDMSANTAVQPALPTGNYSITF